MATTIATLQDQVLAEYSQVVKNLDQVRPHWSPSLVTLTKKTRSVATR